MPIIVDGNNALGFGHLTEQELIERLSRLSRIKSLRIIVCFDGARDHGLGRQVMNKLTLLYSGHYHSADDLILTEVSRLKDTHDWTVYTSDQSLASEVRSYQMATAPVQVLLQQLAAYGRESPVDTDSKPQIEPDVDGLVKAMLSKES